MNKDKLLNEFLEKGLNYIKSAEAFTQKEVPLYINEILQYKFYEELSYTLWAFPLLFIGVVLAYFTVKLFKEDDCGEVYIGCGSCALFMLTLSVCTFISKLLPAIQIKIAPRMYLIEYFKGLM